MGTRVQAEPLLWGVGLAPVIPLETEPDREEAGAGRGGSWWRPFPRTALGQVAEARKGPHPVCGESGGHCWRREPAPRPELREGNNQGHRLHTGPGPCQEPPRWGEGAKRTLEWPFSAPRCQAHRGWTPTHRRSHPLPLCAPDFPLLVFCPAVCDSHCVKNRGALTPRAHPRGTGNPRGHPVSIRTQHRIEPGTPASWSSKPEGVRPEWP